MLDGLDNIFRVIQRHMTRTLYAFVNALTNLKLSLLNLSSSIATQSNFDTSKILVVSSSWCLSTKGSWQCFYKVILGPIAAMFNFVDWKVFQQKRVLFLSLDAVRAGFNITSHFRILVCLLRSFKLSPSFSSRTDVLFFLFTEV